MKKKILLFLLLFIPFMVNAEEKCTIVSGNGKDIGSEIACAGEHFYIIEDKEDSVRMLAKYNLDYGYVYNKVTVSLTRYEELKTLCGGYNDRCDLVYNESEFTGYNEIVSAKKDTTNETYTYVIRKSIDSDIIKQSSKAIGAHGDESGKPEFPEYGVVGFWSGDYNIKTYYGNDNFADVEIGEMAPLSDYEIYLNQNEIIIQNIDLITVNNINSLVYKLTNKYLPLEEWGDWSDWTEGENTLGKGHLYEYWIIGSIKDYLPDGYEWLYNTTYWTKTVKPIQINEYTYFVDTLGNLCNANTCEISVGAGIRPVVEINKNIINYNLTTKTNSNGTLETEKSHVVGDTIVLNAKPKTGYKLEKLIVTTASGTTIEVSGKDIIENGDGTISINPEVFTMPLENVVVEAKWAFVNPKTGVSSFIGIIFTLLLIGISGFFMIKNYSNSYEL